MLRALSGLENPKYKNCYVLFVKGFFGDGDEYFTDILSSGGYIANADSQSTEDKEKYIENAYKAYQHFSGDWVEDRSDLPEEHQKYIHGASWDNEVLPTSIDEINLLYYDNIGHPNDVEIV